MKIKCLFFNVGREKMTWADEIDCTPDTIEAELIRSIRQRGALGSRDVGLTPDVDRGQTDPPALAIVVGLWRVVGRVEIIMTM